MSDTSQGPGWWMASDSKWYPPESRPAPTTARQTTGQPPSWLVTGGSGLVVIASFMPWATASFFGITLNKNGTEGDGVLTLFLCGAAAIMGIAMVRGATRRALGVWVLVLVVLALLVGIYDTIDISRVADDKRGMVSVGYGLWLTDAGAIVALVGAVLWLRSGGKRSTEASHPRAS